MAFNRYIDILVFLISALSVGWITPSCYAGVVLYTGFIGNGLQRHPSNTKFHQFLVNPVINSPGVIQYPSQPHTKCITQYEDIYGNINSKLCGPVIPIRQNVLQLHTENSEELSSEESQIVATVADPPKSASDHDHEQTKSEGISRNIRLLPVTNLRRSALQGRTQRSSFYSRSLYNGDRAIKKDDENLRTPRIRKNYFDQFTKHQERTKKYYGYYGKKEEKVEKDVEEEQVKKEVEEKKVEKAVKEEKEHKEKQEEKVGKEVKKEKEEKEDGKKISEHTEKHEEEESKKEKEEKEDGKKTSEHTEKHEEEDSKKEKEEKEDGKKTSEHTEKHEEEKSKKEKMKEKNEEKKEEDEKKTTEHTEKHEEEKSKEEKLIEKDEKVEKKDEEKKVEIKEEKEEVKDKDQNNEDGDEKYLDFDVQKGHESIEDEGCNEDSDEFFWHIQNEHSSNKPHMEYDDKE